MAVSSRSKNARRGRALGSSRRSPTIAPYPPIISMFEGSFQIPSHDVLRHVHSHQSGLFRPRLEGALKLLAGSHLARLNCIRGSVPHLLFMRQTRFLRVRAGSPSAASGPRSMWLRRANHPHRCVFNSEVLQADSGQRPQLGRAPALPIADGRGEAATCVYQCAFGLQVDQEASPSEYRPEAGARCSEFDDHRALWPMCADFDPGGDVRGPGPIQGIGSGPRASASSPDCAPKKRSSSSGASGAHFWGRPPGRAPGLGFLLLGTTLSANRSSVGNIFVCEGLACDILGAGFSAVLQEAPRNASIDLAARSHAGCSKFGGTRPSRGQHRLGD